MLESFAWFAAGAIACWVLTPSRRDIERQVQIAAASSIWREALIAFEREETSERAWALVDAMHLASGEECRDPVTTDEEDTEEENEDQ